MKIRDAILRKQSEERTNISRGFELEKAKAVPIGTVNKYGEIKTAQGWVYQKKGTQKVDDKTKSDIKKPTSEEVTTAISNAGKAIAENKNTDLMTNRLDQARSLGIASGMDIKKVDEAIQTSYEAYREEFKKASKYQPHEIGEDTNDNRFVETPIDEVIQHSITQVGAPMQYQAEQEMLRRAYKKLGKPATGLSQAIDVLKEDTTSKNLQKLNSKLGTDFSIDKKVTLNDDIHLVSLSDLRGKDLTIVGIKETNLISQPLFLQVKSTDSDKVIDMNPEYVSNKEEKRVSTAKDSGTYEDKLKRDDENRKKFKPQNFKR